MHNVHVQTKSISEHRAPFYKRAFSAFVSEGRLPYQLKLRLSRVYYWRKLSIALFHFVRWTPPVDSTETSDLEIVTLLDRANVNAYLIGIKSFFFYARRRARVTVLSDGSITEAQLKLIKKHIRGVRIILSKGGRVNVPHLSSRLQKIYDEHVHTRKALALPLDDLKDTIVLMDSDVVFCDWVDDEFTELRNVDLKYNRDHDHRLFDPLFHVFERFLSRVPVKREVYNLNSGLLIFRKHVLNVTLVAEFLLYLEARDQLHAVMEQDSYALLASMVNSEPLSDRYWVGCNPDHMNRPETWRNAIAKHYVGGVRYRNLDYVRDCWRAMWSVRRGLNVDLGV